MARRPSTQTFQGTLQKYIGSDFDIVLEVYKNLDRIRDVVLALGKFDNYLGSFPIPPTSRPNDEPLMPGDYYLDSTHDVIWVWDNEWIAISPDYWLHLAEEEVIRSRDAANASAQSAEDSAQHAINSQTSATTTGMYLVQCRMIRDELLGLKDTIKVQVGKASEYAAQSKENQHTASVAANSASNAAIEASQANDDAHTQVAIGIAIVEDASQVNTNITLLAQSATLDARQIAQDVIFVDELKVDVSNMYTELSKEIEGINNLTTQANAQLYVVNEAASQSLTAAESTSKLQQETEHYSDATYQLYENTQGMANQSAQYVQDIIADKVVAEDAAHSSVLLFDAAGAYVIGMATKLITMQTIIAKHHAFT